MWVRRAAACGWFAFPPLPTSKNNSLFTYLSFNNELDFRFAPVLQLLGLKAALSKVLQHLGVGQKYLPFSAYGGIFGGKTSALLPELFLAAGWCNLFRVNYTFIKTLTCILDILYFPRGSSGCVLLVDLSPFLTVNPNNLSSIITVH